MPSIIRLAQPADLPQVADLDNEAFLPYGTAETPETFIARLQAFPAGFVVLEVEGQIAAYGCSEKWLSDQEPGLDQNPLATHQPNGHIFCITGMAVRLAHRGRGYGLAVLDHLIEIARQQGCTKIVLETTHAQGLYRKRNFVLVRSREERGVRLDIMVLELG
jgi:ribosomal protein S18 acetylase RimI-like enzyme